MSNRNIRPKDWCPVGVEELEPNADRVVRSNINYSVIAGPGAGKTELLAQRACYLLQTGMCPYPHRILAISFKRDAAKNLKDRVAERCSKEDALRFDSFTFDAFSKSILDRFIGALPEHWQPTKDYEIYPWKEPEYQNFLRSLADNPSNAPIKSDLLRIYSEAKYFERNYILSSPLPPEGILLTSAASLATNKWWQACLHNSQGSRLTFRMIGRLAELLLRTNPKICKALRATYSSVFMDEFQDTTHVQYDLVKTAFLNSLAILTAVGDNKQRIMGWAMALDNAFGEFERDFQAERIELSDNYRSSCELVRIQHQLALSIVPSCKPVNSKNSKKILEEACVIWDFQTPEAEAEHLAKTIASSIRDYELTPRDFVLLVKQKPDSYEPMLKQAFKQHGLKVRVTQQDILPESLTKIFVAFLRFCSRERGGVYWSDCYKLLTSLRGIDPKDSRNGRVLQDELNDFHSSLLVKMRELPDNKRQINFILEAIETFIGQHTIKLIYPEYQQGNRYKELRKKIIDQLLRSCEIVQGRDWDAVLDDFEGFDSVQIMTIHKSKGLEHHTVIFVGLDDSAWWSFQNQPEESRCAFFVALSRAKQRIIFTYCEQRGQGRNTISSLYDILDKAGVKIEQI